MLNDSTRYGPLDDAVVECANPRQTPERLRLASSPLLAALARAGTEHVYVDTAAVEELSAVAVTASGRTRWATEIRSSSAGSSRCVALPRAGAI